MDELLRWPRERGRHPGRHRGGVQRDHRAGERDRRDGHIAWQRTGLDIATVAWEVATGDRADSYWPSDGARRYNYDPEDGDDRAVELGGARVFDVQESLQGDLVVTVLGTSYGGTTKLDDYTTHQWSGTGTSVAWDARYDNGDEDVARGLSVHDDGLVYVTGYSKKPSTSLTTPDYDYATLCYFVGFEQWEERFDYAGKDDFPSDIHTFDPVSGDREVWVTGAGTDTSNIDVATVRYLDDFGSVTDTWSDAWGQSAAFQYGRAMTVFEGEPYITGAQGAATWDRMLSLMYFEDPPDYTSGWYSTRTGGGGFSGPTDHEGRGVVVQIVDTGSDRSIYVTGVSTVSGEGREFTTLRYKE